MEGGAAARRAVTRFLTRLADMEPLVDGNDLRSLGIGEGPLLGEILASIREAQLDGAVTDRDGALALARELAAAEGNDR
jgi:hypothetical protein